MASQAEALDDLMAFFKLGAAFEPEAKPKKKLQQARLEIRRQPKKPVVYQAPLHDEVPEHASGNGHDREVPDSEFAHF